MRKTAGGHHPALLIAHLAEFDSRGLYLGAGFPSLFTYCCEVLHLSEPAAYNRIEVARAARSCPAILAMLAEGRLSLATVRLLASHLTTDNQQELLAEAAGKSKRAVEELLVRYFPKPEVPSSVRKLPGAKPLLEPPRALSSLPPALVMPAASRRPVVAPLTPERHEVRVTVSAEARDDLREAQDLLRHAIPSGDPAQVTVGSRDDGRCTFVGKGGRRCNERGFVEFHHDEPYGIGGENTVGNIKLLCRAHNAFESVRFYGHGRPTSPTLPGKSPPISA